MNHPLIPSPSHPFIHFQLAPAYVDTERDSCLKIHPPFAATHVLRFSVR
jgi:hypothetical protein